MLKLPFGPAYETLRRTLAARDRELEKLRAETERLRGSLIAAQEAKTQAVRQAEELRKEKERLRQKASDLKKSLDQEARIREQLQEKIGELRKQNEELDTKLRKRK